MKRSLESQEKSTSGIEEARTAATKYFGRSVPDWAWNVVSDDRLIKWCQSTGAGGLLGRTVINPTKTEETYTFQYRGMSIDEVVHSVSKYIDSIQNPTKHDKPPQSRKKSRVRIYTAETSRLTNPGILKKMIEKKTLKIPQKKAIVIKENEITLQDWNEQFDGDTGMYNIINCDMVQMMPGYNYVSGVDIYCDENGFMKPVNQLASRLLGEYVFGGKLHGTICLTKEKKY